VMALMKKILVSLFILNIKLSVLLKCLSKSFRLSLKLLTILSLSSIVRHNCPGNCNLSKKLFTPIGLAEHYRMINLLLGRKSESFYWH
jgi:hypothetical protein